MLSQPTPRTTPGRHRLRASLVALILVATLLGALAPPTAEAQFAVLDVANFGQNLLTALRTAEGILQRIQSLQNQIAQIEHMLTNLEELADPSYREILSLVSRILETMERDTKGLIYSHRQLDERFREIYRLEPSTGDVVVEERLRVETAVETARAALLATRLQGEDLIRSQGTLAEMKGQALAAGGNLEALQAVALLEAHTAEEVGKLTQQMLLQTNLTAVALAEALASRSAAEETFRAAVEQSHAGVGPYASVEPLAVIPTNYRR